jgi:uncharacterized membrane protein
MENEGDPGQREDREGSRPQELTALEERVGRLEVELAALRRQLAGESVGQVTAVVGVPAARTSPPPPPVPVPVAEAGGVTPQRLDWSKWQMSSSRPATEAVAESRESFENQLGSQIFNRIAIVLLLIGAAYFLKLAVDRGWITPTGRVLAGLIAGTGLVVWSERFRHKGFAAFSYSLKAVGTGVLYLSLWAAFQLFHLINAPVALFLMLAVTAWNAYMAWVQDSELLAAYALAGGFSTPMLLSTGGNHETFLFSYLLAIDIAIVALVRLREWPRLLLGAFPLTVAFFIGWYAEFYGASELTITSIFIALFGLVFASVPLRLGVAADGPPIARVPQLNTLLEDILLPLANAAFVALAFYSVLEDSGHHALLPWLMIVLAAVCLGLMRLPQAAIASAIHLSLAVVFLTIAIPLKASGHWITVSWLVEGLALLWVATRLRTDDDAGNYAGRTLRWLSVASLALGFGGVCVHLTGSWGALDLPFFNKATGTALTGIAVFAAAAWLALRTSSSATEGVSLKHRDGWISIATAAVVLIVVTAGLMTLREVGTSWISEYSSNPHLPFRSADFLTALLALGIFAGVVAAALRIAKERVGEDFWTNCAAVSTIAFNLIAVLTGVREVSAVWSASPNTWSAEGALQQALAISAFLMLYGAALLAVGFWKRSGFLRWQALVLLVVTICKTFLYDMRSLSQGYRVASLLGLGALLMAISFAYQKDWLNLRQPEDKHSADPGATR